MKVFLVEVTGTYRLARYNLNVVGMNEYVGTKKFILLDYNDVISLFISKKKSSL